MLEIIWVEFRPNTTNETQNFDKSTKLARNMSEDLAKVEWLDAIL
jgi:hypothetical protein